MSKQKSRATAAQNIEIRGSLNTEFESILTPEALNFVAQLGRRFSRQREELLAKRHARQREFDAGRLPDFLPETAEIRNSDWKIGPVPKDLHDRRVEITGPVDRKMVINALNSGANIYMADFEDSHTPTWEGTIEGQINLRDAIRGTMEYFSPEGKQYRLKDKLAALIVRPRGWHLVEKHMLLDGAPVAGALFDFGLFFFHNVRALLAKGTGPYFYLPKIESHLEARLWNDVFNYAQDARGIPRGTIKATVLIETILAAFEMDEILYELRDHCVGLNCGRWDYIFSYIKKFHADSNRVLPNRGKVTMTTHFLRSYSLLLVKTCHRRGAFAMGGMAAQIPIKNDPQANEAALAKVRADKEREAGDGYDGTWVAHPGLVELAKAVFDRFMPRANQIDKQRHDVQVTAADLLQVPSGSITEEGLRNNIAVALQYLEAWLGGLGCVPIYNLMEDAATAEIARAQLWQWIRHPRGVLTDGRRVTVALFRQTLNEELAKIRDQVGEQRYVSRHYLRAAELLDKITTDKEFIEFLTLVAYEEIS